MGELPEYPLPEAPNILNTDLESGEPHRVELNDFIQGLDLPKDKTKLLGSRLKQFNFFNLVSKLLCKGAGKKIGCYI